MLPTNEEYKEGNGGGTSRRLTGDKRSLPGALQPFIIALKSVPYLKSPYVIFASKWKKIGEKAIGWKFWCATAHTPCRLRLSWKRKTSATADTECELWRSLIFSFSILAKISPFSDKFPEIRRSFTPNEKSVEFHN